VNIHQFGPVLLGATIVLTARPAAAIPCSIVAPISAVEMVRSADAIVRATAVEYARAPADPEVFTTGEPDSLVRFKLEEILKGKDIHDELVLSGYLSERDDFNDHRSPYTFVRPGGRAGSCFANSYRRGAQFLLLLKGSRASFTVNWYALGPVNEQLRSATDPWLLWVRDQVRRGRAQPNQRLQPTAVAISSR
jgi:hypothetical protein